MSTDPTAPGERLAQIAARLSDEWPEGEGVECRPGKVGGKPCLIGTRWYVNIWHSIYRSEDSNAIKTDDCIRAGWPDLSEAQIATARAYVLANLPLFDARETFNSDVDELKRIYREDCGSLLAEVAALRRTAEARDRALVDIRDTLRTAIEHHHECYGGRSEHFGVTLAYSEILEMHEELAAALAAPDGGK